MSGAPRLQETAVSPESRSLENILVNERRHQQQSVSLYGAKQAVVNAIWSLFGEHGHADWDGAGAEALDQGAVRFAIALIDVLPENLPMPEVSVDPDGAVLLDWIANKHQSLTVSIDATGIIPYAWIDNGDRGHGVVRFDGERCPKSLVRLITDTTGTNDASVWAA